MPWDSIITLLNNVLKIYIDETSPIMIYKRRINAKYKEWKNMQSKLETLRAEIKSAVMEDRDDDVQVLTHQRSEIIRKMDTANNDLKILWEMRDLIVPKDVIIEK